MEKISFTEIFSSAQPRHETARLIADSIRQARHYSWVGLYDVKEKEIALIASAGRTEPAFTSFPRDKGLNGRAVMQKKTVVVNDVNKDEDYILTFSNTESEIVVPVFAEDGDTVIGTIDAESETKNTFGAEDAAFLEDCAKAIRPLWKNN
jgi:GAF domain-containing protein